MNENLKLDDKLVIIKNAGMEDVVILDDNYRHLIHENTDPTERVELVILRSKVLDRIKELSGDN